MFTVSAHGVDENYASEFRSAVLGILKEIAVNGLREKELGYFKSRMETDAALSREGSQAAADLLMSTVNYSSNGRDILTYMKLRDRMRDMSWFDNDLIKSVASSLATPRRSAMAIVTPRPGLLEAERQKRDEALEKFGSSMTDAEKKKIADDEKRIVEAASDDPAEYVKGLSVTGIADLSDEIKTYSVGDSTDDRGMRHVGVYSSTKGVYVTKICLDASAVPADMLGYLSLYVDLVNGRFVPTGKYGQDELADMISCCNRGQDISLTVSSLGKNFRPYVAVQFMCAPEMTQTAFDLAYERLFDSKFEDPVKIRDGVTSIRQVTGDNIASNQGQTARYIAYSDDAPGAAYYENTHYLEYYDFLKKVEDNIGGDYKNVCAKLNEIGELIRYTDSSVIGYVLPKEEEKQYLKISEGFEKKLKDTGKEENRYEFEKYGEATGLITGSAVAGNVAAVGDISKYGIEEDDAALALSLSLVNEKYLRKMTRDRYGAYTCSYAEEYPVVSVFTARDPVIKETYDAFSGLKDAWSDIKASLTQSELEEYITKMYSQEMMPSGDISDAMKVLSDMIAWRGADRRKRRCAQLKDATVQSLSKYDKLFENIGTKGRKVSTGDAQLINDNKDVFAKVIDPFAK
ncbi:MAG: hypothetical protein IKQ40_00810 [Lachnospiraceae bacterium]|nr:hypothetical protein [Lachnospiraceae bacterium]